jgi:hypothetical protein
MVETDGKGEQMNLKADVMKEQRLLREWIKERTIQIIHNRTLIPETILRSESYQDLIFEHKVDSILLEDAGGVSTVGAILAALDDKVSGMNLGSLVYIVTEPGGDHKTLWDSPEYSTHKIIGSVTKGQKGIILDKAIENSGLGSGLGLKWVKIAFTSGFVGWIEQVWVEEVGEYEI